MKSKTKTELLITLAFLSLLPIRSYSFCKWYYCEFDDLNTPRIGDIDPAGTQRMKNKKFRIEYPIAPPPKKSESKMNHMTTIQATTSQTEPNTTATPLNVTQNITELLEILKIQNAKPILKNISHNAGISLEKLAVNTSRATKVYLPFYFRNHNLIPRGKMKVNQPSTIYLFEENDSDTVIENSPPFFFAPCSFLIFTMHRILNQLL